MKFVVVALVGMFVGILLGGYGPSAELKTLQEGQTDSGVPGNAEPCESNVGSDLATLLGNGVARTDRPSAAPTPDEEPPDPRAVEMAAELDAANKEAEEEIKRELTEVMADEEELELARTALELRRTQARAALLEDTDAEDEQMEQFDTAVDAMNDVLMDLTEEMTEMVDGGREPGRREAMEFAADALDALLSAEDNMRSAFDAGQLSDVEDSAIDPFSHIDPAIIDVLEGLDFEGGATPE